MPILANHRKAAAKSTRARSISAAGNRSLSNFGALITVIADLHFAQSSLRRLPSRVNPDWRLDGGQRGFFLDQIRRPFGDHDRGGIRVSADDRRHDRGIHHAQPKVEMPTTMDPTATAPIIAAGSAAGSGAGSAAGSAAPPTK
jgi:hypothetical protein